MSMTYLRDAVASVNWSLVAEVGLGAACLALAFWLRPRAVRARSAVSIQSVEVPAAPRARSYRTVPTEASEQPHKLVGSFMKSVTSCLPLGSELACRAPLELSPPLVAKRKKSVTFAEEKNETRLVDNWIDPLVHQHHQHRGHVRFYGMVYEQPVSRWIEPDGHNQLHFPRTVWIRNIPDATVEDDDGDIAMLDG